MTERMFPLERRWPRRDLLEALVLHRLLTGHPGPIATERLTGELAGHTPTRGETHAVRNALTRLAHHGLVDLTEATAEASRPARRFHHLMLTGPDNTAGDTGDWTRRPPEGPWR